MAAPSLPNPRRWRVLIAFVLAAMVTQLLWLNFAPILLEVQDRYKVDEDTATFGLVAAFPLLYCLLSVHSGRLIDRLGYKKVVGAGAVVTAAGSLIRLDTDHFWSLVAGQVVIACAQPYVVNGISKLVADWFTGEEGAMATGLGTVGMFLGMAIGLGTTPLLDTAIGLRATMGVNSAIAIGAAIAWYALAAETGLAEAENPSPFGDLLRNGRLRIMVGLGALGLGFFNGLTTYLEQLTKPRAMNAEQAGILGMIVVIGGIVGAIVVPPIADKLRLRKLPLLVCAAGALGGFVWLYAAGNAGMSYAAGAALGFAFMPAFALLLAMTGEVVQPRDNGAATSLVMLAGNGAGVLVIVLTPMAGAWDGPGPWALLGATVVATVALAGVAPETFPGRQAA